MFSNDYEDECATICKICTRHLNFGNLGAHLHQSHGIKMRDYQVWTSLATSLLLFGHQERFGEPEITRKSYHECGICHETLLFIRSLLLTWTSSTSSPLDIIWRCTWRTSMVSPSGSITRSTCRSGIQTLDNGMTNFWHRVHDYKWLPPHFSCTMLSTTAQA